MKKTSVEEKEYHTFIPNFRPLFHIVGSLSKGQRLMLKAVEDLFFIEFIENNNNNVAQQKNIMGKIIFLPKDLKILNTTKYSPDKKIPNLMLNITAANILSINELFDEKITGTVLECQNYFIHPDREAFGPLRGFNIKEKNSRNIVVLSPMTNIESLISSKDSSVFCKFRNVYISTVELPEIMENYGLRDEFDDLHFMGTLPLFFFLRQCLCEQYFSPVNNSACCIIDDPNLRWPKYGYMKYSDVVKSAKLHDYHVSIGMIPIDYKKIGRKTLDIFQNNRSHISVMMHGNDHSTKEMLTFSPEIRKKLEQALWRMNKFAHKSDLKWAKGMVFPHDSCSKKTISMMRELGYQAVFMQRAYPTEIGDWFKTPNPLFEMFLSENTIEGFPIINRQSIESHHWHHNWYHQVLFHAWLGKPIIPFTHHYFFVHGFDELEKRVAHINRHILPEWTDISGVLNGNYTIAHRNGRVYVNAYSNQLNIVIPDNVSEIVFTKHGRDLPVNEEILMVNGGEHDWEHKGTNYLSSVIKTDNQSSIQLDLIPRYDRLESKKHSTPIIAYLRRYGCEIRDQTEPYFKWHNGFITNSISKK